jgi:wyosine [tRNA(Phe)-imidazoG37] synthetase (radical SAM superfamily)
MYKYLFGPVPSRRLGISLGIDLVPHKICSLDCIYCECGPTGKLTLERKEYVPFDKIKKELDHYFANGRDPDYFTFSGSGEPTLNLCIGRVLRYIRSGKPGIPIAVLTNGTLLNLKEVRYELLDADVVLPSLDTASQVSFQKMNRPCHKLDISEYIKGLEIFRDEYPGKIWLEVFIMPGYNDHETDLQLLKEAFGRIRPDRIQLNTLDRPGTIPGLRAAGHSELQKIITFWQLPNVEIISKTSGIHVKNISYRADTETAILETIARRPCTVSDLSVILGLHTSEIKKYLDDLESENKILSVHQDRGIFYQTAVRNLPE